MCIYRKKIDTPYSPSLPCKQKILRQIEMGYHHKKVQGMKHYAKKNGTHVKPSTYTHPPHRQLHYQMRTPKRCTCYMTVKRHRNGEHVAMESDHDFNVRNVSGYNLQWLDSFCMHNGVKPSDITINKAIRSSCALGPPSLTESIEDRLIRALRLGTVMPHQIMCCDDALGEDHPSDTSSMYTTW